MSEATERSRLQVAAACLLAWLLPGAGHAFTRHWRRAAVFFAIVVSMVVLGLVEDGNLSVVSETAPNLTRLQVAVNLALGPVEPVIRRAVYGELVYDRRSRSPQVRRFMAVRKGRALRAGSPYGTAYLWTAGLLNLLLVLDAFDLATGRKR